MSVSVYLASSIWGVCFSSKQIVQTNTANKILVKLKYLNNIFCSNEDTKKKAFSVLKEIIEEKKHFKINDNACHHLFPTI